MPSIKALRWMCRRGMLELDLVLERFLTTQGDVLSAEVDIQLRALLEQKDPVLYQWLIIGVQPDAPHQAIVSSIRAAQKQGVY
jgi:antitoxin CptB